MISFHISDHTITFIAQKKSWTVHSSNSNFQQIKEGLLTASADEAQLVDWASPVTAFVAAGNGSLEIRGNEVLFRGNPIANIWVDKLFQFKTEGLPFDAPLKALESLMRNPSRTARERLPIFVERNKLGFLPDGRIVGLKVVRDNYKDCHSGSFDNSPGKVISMPRDEVDDNWENDCSHGFHIGAFEYLPYYGLYDSNKRVVLCAFSAEDAVAIPKDYNGSKLRVCKYEVLEELEKDAIEQYLAEHQTLINREDLNDVGEGDPGEYDYQDDYADYDD